MFRIIEHGSEIGRSRVEFTATKLLCANRIEASRCKYATCVWTAAVEIVQLVLLAASQALNSKALRAAARGRASVGETHALLLRRRLLGSDDSGGRSLRLAVQLQLTHFRLQAQSDGPHRNRARSAPTGGSAQADPIRRRRMLPMHVRRRCRRAHDNRLRESTHARVPAASASPTATRRSHRQASAR